LSETLQGRIAGHRTTADPACAEGVTKSITALDMK